MVKKKVEEATIKDLLEYVALAIDDIAEQLTILNSEMVMLRATWQSLKPAPVETATEEEAT